MSARMLAPALLLLFSFACDDKGAGGNDTGTVGGTDADGDGFSADEDCDDDNEGINPGATEICDGIDNDCDALIDDEDDGIDASSGGTWYPDADEDGHGSPEGASQACEQPAGMVAEGDDCDDANASISPEAGEICDEIDNDCDDLVDDDDELSPDEANTWYTDGDSDGYGDIESTQLACEQPAGTIGEGGDCDDADPAINPAATEVCDEADVDEDCNGLSDDDDPGVDSSTQLLTYPDADGDGHGDMTDPGTLSCEPGAAGPTDCLDSDPTVHDGATELCDGQDNDCDGTVPPDEADADGDGYVICEIDAGGWDGPSSVTGSGDCDDLAASRNPGATEVCDGYDSDCNSATTDAGMATFWDAAGTATDWSATLAAGTSSAPAGITLSTDGILAICDGTWYTNLVVQANVEISNPLGDPTAVILDGAGSGPVVSITTDGLDVVLEGLTLQNGLGDASSFGVEVGGGILCVASSNLDIASVQLTGNTADAGAGMISLGCTGSFDDLVISGNEATGEGGGAYLGSAAITISNSEILDNTAEHGGGLYIEDLLAATAITFDEVAIYENEATYGGGAVLEEGSFGITTSCSGSTGTIAGFTGNSATLGGALYFEGDPDLSATSCDFGTVAGSDDNDPADIYNAETGWEYLAGTDATFSCTSGICGTSATHTVGGTHTSLSGDNRARGVMVLADTEATIDGFQVYLDADTSCSLDFYMLSASSTSGPWTMEWSNIAASTGSGARFYDAGDVGVSVRAGTYYSFMVGWRCSASGDTVTYYRTPTTTGSHDPGFGTFPSVYPSYDSYTTPWTSAPTLSIIWFAAWYYVQFDVTEL